GFNVTYGVTTTDTTGGATKGDGAGAVGVQKVTSTNVGKGVTKTVRVRAIEVMGDDVTSTIGGGVNDKDVEGPPTKTGVGGATSDGGGGRIGDGDIVLVSGGEYVGGI
ncbi:unnamed protein product, partial [Ilex paraguariensis]